MIRPGTSSGQERDGKPRLGIWLCQVVGAALFWVIASGWAGAGEPTLVRKPARPAKPNADRVEADRPAAETARNPFDELKVRVERAASQLEVSQRQRDHATIRRAFRDVVAASRSATVQVWADDVPIAYGAIVSADGYVITKASELRGNLTCALSDKRKLSAKIVATRPEHDLALLRIESDEPLPVVEWSRETLEVGSFLATAGQDELPTAIGVVSVSSRRIAAATGFLGVGLHDPRPKVTQVQPGSAADKAGLVVDDLVLSIDGQKVDSREALQSQIRKLSPGQRIELAVRRGQTELKVAAVLGEAQAGLQSERVEFQNRLGGSVSARRAGFESVFQHDTVLHPNECGGPLVDLDGKVAGINIARAGRVASYAVPASIVAPLVERMLSEQRGNANVAEVPSKVPMSAKVGG